MPRHSPYRIDLSDEERTVLRSLDALKSSRWPASCRRQAACRCRAGPPGSSLREAVTRGIAEQISGVTVWRWLTEDAIKPWQHRSWIFPRDPNFAAKAAPILDLYRLLAGRAPAPGDYVVCADEKPTIQARKRTAATCPARRGEGQRVEHEYERMARCATSPRGTPGARRSFDRCAPKDGIEPFGALVADLDSLEYQLLAFGAAVRTDRRALPMEVHPPRPRQAPHQDRHRCARRARRVIRARTSEPDHLA